MRGKSPRQSFSCHQSTHTHIRILRYTAYNCALSRDVLVQGKLYISETFLSFRANIFGEPSRRRCFLANLLILKFLDRLGDHPSDPLVRNCQHRKTFDGQSHPERDRSPDPARDARLCLLHRPRRVVRLDRHRLAPCSPRGRCRRRGRCVQEHDARTCRRRTGPI